MLRLNEDQVFILKEQARRAFPNEACGFLVGTRLDDGNLSVEEVVACRNTSAMPVQRFELDSALHLKIQREARDKGQIILGCYHSHPKGPALPSNEDLARAIIPEWVWVIIGEAEGRPLSVRAFVLEQADKADKRFVPLPVSVDTFVL